MTDLRTQRNLAVAGAAVAVALLLGFMLGRGGRQATSAVDAPRAVAADGDFATGDSPVSLPEVGAENAPVDAAVAEPASAARRAESAPRGATSPSNPAPAVSERQAGERWTQEQEAETAETPAADDAAGEEDRAATAPEPVRLTVAEGTQITLELLAPLSSQTARVGDRVEAELMAPVEVDGRVALPAGAALTGRVTEANALGRIGGQARLAFSFESVRVDGREVPIAAHFAREGKSETGKDAATIAAGAAIGTILGNQSRKNDRGKVIGGVVGAAAGTAAAAATKGETIELVAGAELRLTLRQAVTVSR